MERRRGGGEGVSYLQFGHDSVKGSTLLGKNAVWSVCCIRCFLVCPSESWYHLVTAYGVQRAYLLHWWDFLSVFVNMYPLATELYIWWVPGAACCLYLILFYLNIKENQVTSDAVITAEWYTALYLRYSNLDTYFHFHWPIGLHIQCQVLLVACVFLVLSYLVVADPVHVVLLILSLFHFIVTGQLLISMCHVNDTAQVALQNVWPILKYNPHDFQSSIFSHGTLNLQNVSVCRLFLPVLRVTSLTVLAPTWSWTSL